MKILTILFCFLAVAISYAQSTETAGELNERAKFLLQKDNTKAAFPLLKRAAAMGNAEAQYNYGYCYQRGIEVEQNDSIANVWFLKSAKKGWKVAQLKLANNYAAGKGVKPDYEKAFAWSLKCAWQHEPECMLNAASCYENGTGTWQNTDSMIAWTARLGLLENPASLRISGTITTARLKLAELYRDGRGVKMDSVRSYTWYLLFNEHKKDFSVAEQQPYIDTIEELEKHLSEADKKKAKANAEKLIGHPLKNFANLHKQEV